MKNEKYILNHDYILRHDLKRSFIVAKYNNNDSSHIGTGSFIHPVQAMILSFFSEADCLENICVKLSDFLEVTIDEVMDLISPFLENGESFYTEYKNCKLIFPKKVIIKETENKSKINTYTTDEFEFDPNNLNFSEKRFYSGPLNITFMPNNVCATDCIYCYADKSTQVKNYLNFDRLKEIFNEAQALRVINFNVVGGEVFTYPQWEELLKYSIQVCDYMPARISTKVPLSFNKVKKLKELGIDRIQVSVDSLIESNLSRILQTDPKYQSKIISFLKYLDAHEININVQTVLTTLNSSVEDMMSIYNVIKTLKNLGEWIIRPAFPSLYRGNWFVPNLTSIDHISEYIDRIKPTISVSLDSTFLKREYLSASGGSENFKGAECSANRSHFFILPDGKVTICEQLYWKPNFIIGDLRKQSIKEVWNSRKSQWFINLQIAQLSDENPCKTCEIFEGCYKNMNRCWAEVVKAYGDEKWDYPDPRCKIAPPMKTNLIYS